MGFILILGLITVITFSVFPITGGQGQTTAAPSSNNSSTITVSISTSGSTTAGEAYSLVCSITVTESTNLTIITWIDPMNNTVLSDRITTTAASITLTFNPLTASHAGVYTCRAASGGEIQADTESVTIQSE